MRSYQWRDLWGVFGFAKKKKGGEIEGAVLRNCGALRKKMSDVVARIQSLSRVAADWLRAWLGKREMGCQCCLVSIGYAALAFAAYKVLTAVANIIYPFFIASPVDLKKKAGASWAVVTGATDGIGKAYAKELARRGFNILLVSRTQSKLDDTKKEILEQNNKEKIDVRTFAFDFTKGNVVDYEPLVAEMKKIDVGVLVNNVGMSYEYPEVLHNVDGGLQRLGNICTINTLPVTLLSAAVLGQMVERKAGVVINLSSSASYNTMSHWAVYSATKKYVTWLSSILRMEYAAQGVTVQTVLPMMVSTNMSKIRKTSLFVPNGETFAKSAVNTIGNADETTGFWSHQLQVEAFFSLPKLFLDKFLTNHSLATRKAALRKRERDAKAQ